METKLYYRDKLNEYINIVSHYPFSSLFIYFIAAASLTDS